MQSEAMTALFRALGGPAGVARLLGRDRSTTSRWLSGARPMPAWAAIRLRELASYLASRMTDAAIELKLKHILEAEQRAPRGRRGGRPFTIDLGIGPISQTGPSAGLGLSALDFDRAGHQGDTPPIRTFGFVRYAPTAMRRTRLVWWKEARRLFHGTVGAGRLTGVRNGTTERAPARPARRKLSRL